MPEHHVVAVGAGFGCLRDHAVPGRKYRRAPGGSVVDAPVRHGAIPERMLAAQVEIRTDSGEGYRRPQEGFAHAPALGVKVVGLVVGTDVASRSVAVALVDELGGQDAAETDELTLQILFLQEHVKRIAVPDVEDEIDIPLEYLG